MTPVLGLLHTSPVHVATFDALAADLVGGEPPAVRLVHLVREELLARAQLEGPDAVAAEIAAVLAGLDADAVLCTCSTVGGVAEVVGGPRVVRVDRPMAAAAVRAADDANGPIGVLAALASTLTPTLDLLAEDAERAGVTVDVRTHLVVGAWERFQAGDLTGYHQLVASAARDAAADGVAVVVLAQASMAPAAELVQLGVPVLSSPRLGLQAAVRLAESRCVSRDAGCRPRRR